MAGGNFQKRGLRDWLPGFAASSPLLLFGAEDRPLANRRVADSASHDGESATSFGKVQHSLRRALSG